MNMPAEPEIARYNPGEVIFLEGDESDSLYIIKSGRVRIVKEVQDRLIPITVIGAQEFLGELAVFDDRPRSSSYSGPRW